MSQSNNPVVLENMEKIHLDKSLDPLIHSKSFNTDMRTNKISVVDDLSLALTDIQEGDNASANISINPDDLLGQDGSVMIQDEDSSAFSQSAASSANFSFMGEADKDSDAYPALYAPDKQEKYENSKKYGLFYPFAPVINFFSAGPNKVYSSFSALVDGVCGGSSIATASQ